MDFINVLDEIRIRNDYLPYPIIDDDLDLKIISIQNIDDNNRFMKFETNDTYVFIDVYDKEFAKGYLVKNDKLYLKFLVNYQKNKYVSVLVNKDDIKKIIKDNLIIDKNNFYFRNVRYDKYSEKISSELNEKINKIVKRNEIKNVIDKVKIFIDNFSEKYEIIVKYGGGRSDGIPHILSIENKEDVFKYSELNTERIAFFDDFIYE